MCLRSKHCWPRTRILFVLIYNMGQSGTGKQQTSNIQYLIILIIQLIVSSTQILMRKLFIYHLISYLQYSIYLTIKVLLFRKCSLFHAPISQMGKIVRICYEKYRRDDAMNVSTKDKSYFGILVFESFHFLQQY
jgi:hypothetical protein